MLLHPPPTTTTTTTTNKKTTDVTIPEGSHANAFGAHDADKCVVAGGVLFRDDENRDKEVARLMEDLPVTDPKPVKSIRLSSRSTCHPPLVKWRFLHWNKKILMIFFLFFLFVKHGFQGHK